MRTLTRSDVSVAVNQYWWFVRIKYQVSLTRKAAKSLRPRPIKVRLEGILSHALSLYMNTDESLLGCCPECGEKISEACILVEYQRNDGTEGVWTECPSCEEVVTPE